MPFTPDSFSGVDMKNTFLTLTNFVTRVLGPASRLRFDNGLPRASSEALLWPACDITSVLSCGLAPYREQGREPWYSCMQPNNHQEICEASRLSDAVLVAVASRIGKGIIADAPTRNEDE